MLIKMRESKGFTLVELMIVVAIIGILAAVAVPFYQRYVQKSRITALFLPAVHSVETNVAAFFAMNNRFPNAASSGAFDNDANFDRVVFSTGASMNVLNFVVRSDTVGTPLYNLDGLTLIATAVENADGTMITNWVLSGSLATELGLR